MMRKKTKTFISVGKFLHNCAALVSLFKPPVMLKKSNTGKLAPMRGKLTIKRDKKQRKKQRMKNSMESQYSLLQVCDYLHIIENVCVRLYNHISLSGTWLRLTCEHS